MLKKNQMQDTGLIDNRYFSIQLIVGLRWLYVARNNNKKNFFRKAHLMIGIL